MRTFVQKQNQSQKAVSTSLARSNMAKLGRDHREHPILHLQGAIGNQAVQRMLQTNGEEREAGLIGTASPRFGHEFSQIPIHPPTAEAIQTKLEINQLGDEYEQEADRIADRVMSTPADAAASGAPLRTQRFSGQSNGQMDVAPASVGQALARPGRPLEPALRQDMEQRFGHDFSRVQVHSGAVAEQSTRDVNAHAYTLGHNIVFGTGQFAPGTHEGRQLLAHELTHVVQQSGAEANVVRRSNGFEMDEPTLVERQNPHQPPFRGHVERGRDIVPGNIASGEIVTDTPPGPKSGGGGGAGPKSGGGGGAVSEGRAATTEAKVTRTLGSVVELGKVGALDAAFFYLQIHAAHFAALENVSNRVEIAKDLLDHVAEFENGARALRNAVNELQRAEAALPEVTKLLETGEQVPSVIVSLGELEYIDAYATSAGNIAGKAFDARAKLNKIIEGWDAVVAQGRETRDFTRKAVVEAGQILDFRFARERGGSFRGFLSEARDDAGRVEAWARSKWSYAKDILDSANLPLKRAMNEAASIRNELMTMARRGGVSAGVLVAIDYLKVAQGANDSAVALEAVKHSLSVLQGISGIVRLTARLSLLQGKLEALKNA